MIYKITRGRSVRYNRAMGIILTENTRIGFASNELNMLCNNKNI